MTLMSTIPDWSAKIVSVLTEHLDYSKPVGWGTRARECDGCLGMGNSMAVQITRKEDGFLWSCHRCRMAGAARYSGFFPDTNASESQVKQIVENAGKNKKVNRPSVVELPADYTTTIPPRGLVQLYNMELEPDDIKDHAIGWSPGHGRIIVPVYKYIGNSTGVAKKLVGVMGRKLNDDLPEKPKWWSQRQSDIKHPRFIVVPEAHGDCRTVVIVENIFSAIKCSKATGWFSLALLTTYLPFELYRPLARYDHVHIWLDQDAYDKACKYQAALGNMNITAHTHVTPKKPKDCTIEEIKSELGLTSLPIVPTL